jgi:nucleoside-diphosphate-sugar epimerase
MNMGTNNELNVVLGASGGIGNAVAQELVAQGKRVRAVNRSGKADLPSSVEIVRGDALDAESVRAVCADASVIYNCVNVPYPEWEAKFPPMMKNITQAASAAKAKLIFADNLYMYGPTNGPMAEDSPYNAHGHKGQLRARMANELMDAHRAGKVRVAIGRAADYYGQGVINAIAGKDLFTAVLAGKKAMWAGSLDQPHTMTFTQDFAKGLIILGERDEALGQVWHIPGMGPITGREFLQIAFEAAGTKPQMGAYSRLMIRFAGLFSPMIREVDEVLYEFENPYIVSGDKFAKAFGTIGTPHKQAIKETVAWFKANAGKI